MDDQEPTTEPERTAYWKERALREQERVRRLDAEIAQAKAERQQLLLAIVTNMAAAWAAAHKWSSRADRDEAYRVLQEVKAMLAQRDH